KCFTCLESRRVLFRSEFLSIGASRDVDAQRRVGGAATAVATRTAGRRHCVSLPDLLPQFFVVTGHQRLLVSTGIELSHDTTRIDACQCIRLGSWNRRAVPVRPCRRTRPRSWPKPSRSSATRFVSACSA